jgi:hypothetical protein
VKLLGRFLVEGISEITFAALRTHVVTEFLGNGFDGVHAVEVFHVLEHLAHRFHVVFFEIGFGDLRGIVGSEYLNFDDVMIAAIA